MSASLIFKGAALGIGGLSTRFHGIKLFLLFSLLLLLSTFIIVLGIEDETTQTMGNAQEDIRMRDMDFFSKQLTVA